MPERKRQLCSRHCPVALAAGPTVPRGSAMLGMMPWISFSLILLVALVATANWARQSGKLLLTRQCLDTLAGALVAYREAEGEFPPTVSSTAELIKRLNSIPDARLRLEEMQEQVFDTTSSPGQILDAWARPLQYVFDRQTGQRPQLKSQGPDPNDPADDIYAHLTQPVFIEKPTKEALQ